MTCSPPETVQIDRVNRFHSGDQFSDFIDDDLFGKEDLLQDLSDSSCYFVDGEFQVVTYNGEWQSLGFHPYDSWCYHPLTGLLLMNKEELLVVEVGDAKRTLGMHRNVDRLEVDLIGTVYIVRLGVYFEITDEGQEMQCYAEH